MSADKRTLVAAFNEDRRSLVLVRVAEGSPPDVTALTQGSSGDFDPAAAPSGDRLAFSSTRNGNRHIWTSRLDGTDAREVTTGDSRGRTSGLVPRLVHDRVRVEPRHRARDLAGGP